MSQFGKLITSRISIPKEPGLNLDLDRFRSLIFTQWAELRWSLEKQLKIQNYVINLKMAETT